jgi:hypothetical protein
MRHFPFPIAICAGFAAVAAASVATPTPARAQDVPTASQQVAANHVWTNQDMDRLRAEGLISTFSPASGGAAPQQTQAPEAVPMPQPIREEDPQWYADQAARLQAELAERQANLQRYLQAIQNTKEHEDMMSGISLDAPIVGITPQDGVEILQAGVDEIQADLDNLADLAREHDIPPGALRG